MGTFVTGIIVLGIAGMAIWRILKKDGKSCGGDCCGCRMSDDSDQ
ncbi:MAG: FeoB-associated Cys-rich membrane protein [Candidatus Accumulibacter sp.]|nr:FeoB-associated Cys-rich membrane protein [Accumulibacter sp.]